MHRRMELQRKLFSSFIGVAFVVSMAATLLFRFSSILRPDKPRLWMVEELAHFNGTDEKLPILLGILGSVFDVTRGKSHYGPGGGYHHFAGRDASRAFASGNFTGKLFSLVGWYYDKDGNPTKHLKGVEAKAKRAARLQEKQKIEEAKIPSCNSKWSQEEGGEVWCDAGYPRLVQRPLEMALNGKRSRRCACFKAEELGQPGLEVYKNCDFLSKSCVV
ncbi:hypothetical protein KFK09_005363 [Dendrobium nobile]|uniref:Cytochrome b5 heme-binding domain-containing protein n=1 Tax=Dendrobium nobile TaxID=94219 RepID=A0A8T3BVI0_DENNO|nr:hypothetical protein KFK09_005363 [Dendrobium nobile]